MHIILISALPVDTSGEAVLLEDLLHLAAYLKGIGVVLRIELLANEHGAVGCDIGVFIGVDVDGRAGIMLRVAAGPIGHDGLDGILLLTFIDLLENPLDGGNQVSVNIEAPGLGDLLGTDAVLEVPDLDRYGLIILLIGGLGCVLAIILTML